VCERVNVSWVVRVLPQITLCVDFLLFPNDGVSDERKRNENLMLCMYFLNNEKNCMNEASKLIE
jgi:hypothetical protein